MSLRAGGETLVVDWDMKPDGWPQLWLAIETLLYRGVDELVCSSMLYCNVQVPAGRGRSCLYLHTTTASFVDRHFPILNQLFIFNHERYLIRYDTCFRRMMPFPPRVFQNDKKKQITSTLLIAPDPHSAQHTHTKQSDHI
jgi:hypothetical protein